MTILFVILLWALFFWCFTVISLAFCGCCCCSCCTTTSSNKHHQRQRQRQWPSFIFTIKPHQTSSNKWFTLFHTGFEESVLLLVWSRTSLSRLSMCICHHQLFYKGEGIARGQAYCVVIGQSVGLVFFFFFKYKTRVERRRQLAINRKSKKWFWLPFIYRVSLSASFLFEHSIVQLL